MNSVTFRFIWMSRRVPFGLPQNHKDDKWGPQVLSPGQAENWKLGPSTYFFVRSWTSTHTLHEPDDLKKREKQQTKIPVIAFLMTVTFSRIEPKECKPDWKNECGTRTLGPLGAHHQHRGHGTVARFFCWRHLVRELISENCNRPVPNTM